MSNGFGKVAAKLISREMHEEFAQLVAAFSPSLPDCSLPRFKQQSLCGPMTPEAIPC